MRGGYFTGLTSAVLAVPTRRPARQPQPQGIPPRAQAKNPQARGRKRCAQSSTAWPQGAKPCAQRYKCRAQGCTACAPGIWTCARRRASTAASNNPAACHPTIHAPQALPPVHLHRRGRYVAKEAATPPGQRQNTVAISLLERAEKITAIAADISELCQRYWPVIAAVFAATHG